MAHALLGFKAVVTSPPPASQRGLSSGPCSSPTDSNSLPGSARNETRIKAADISTATAAISLHQGSTYKPQHGGKVAMHTT